MSTKCDESAAPADAGRGAGGPSSELERLRAERDQAIAARDQAIAERDKARGARDALLRDVLPLARGTRRPPGERRRWMSVTIVAILLIGLGLLVQHMARTMSVLSATQPHRTWGIRTVRPHPAVAARPRRPAPRRVTRPLRESAIALDGVEVVGVAALGPRGRLVAVAGWGGRVQLYDLLLDQTLHILQAHRGAARVVRFVDAERLVTGGADGRVVVWSVRTGKSLRVVREAGKPVRDVVVGGDVLAVASEAPEIEIYSLYRPKLALRRLRGHVGWVRALALDARGTLLASAGHDMKVRLWTLPQGKLSRTLTGHRLWIGALAFDPAARLLASSGFDDRTLLWEVASGKLLHSLRGHVRRVAGLAFDALGGRLATASLDRTVIVWDARRGRPIRHLHGHRYQVSSVAFGPGDAFLLSASTDGTLRLWGLRAAVPQAFRTLPPPGPGELTLRGNTSGDRLRLRVVGADGEVLPAALVQLATFLRSGPDDSQTAPDKRLVRYLYRVAEHFGRQREVIVISGYRSPLFNRLRRGQSKQVARDSRHLRGQAIDFRISGVAITTLHRYLKKRRWGGLGLYPDSNFVHLDVGPVRAWQGD